MKNNRILIRSRCLKCGGKVEMVDHDIEVSADNRIIHARMTCNKCLEPYNGKYILFDISEAD